MQITLQMSGIVSGKTASSASYDVRLETPKHAPERDVLASAAACCSSCKHLLAQAEATQLAAQGVLSSRAHMKHEQPVLFSQGF